jgi:hypothetical protein
VVADPAFGHARADRDDLTGTFVTKHSGRRLGKGPVHGGQVGVAHPGRVNLDLHLAGTRVRDLYVLVVSDLFFSDLMENRCTHGNPLVDWRS